MQRRYSRHSHIEDVEKDVVEEGIDDINHNSGDHLWPYDALNGE